MYLIAGLGNPGKQYFATRHNIGFSAIDYISQKYDIDVSKIKHKGLIGEGRIANERVVLLKPQTYMNLSGESVSAAAAWYKIPNDKIIILYDDISLPVGKLRIRTKGSAGGHNGIKSIIAHLNSDVFGRMKIGVGAPDEHVDLANHVLGHISKEEQTVLFDVLGKTCDAVAEYIANGAQSAMNKYNG
jgi:PTH1 family peptidyl-tRNA hydrolase